MSRRLINEKHRVDPANKAMMLIQNVLYHGTSTARLKQILADGCLRVPTVGDRKVSLTTERDVAEYWARLSVFGDKHDEHAHRLRGLPPDADAAESRGVVLVLDAGRLAAAGYELSPFSDDIWGVGKCDWEREIASWGDIKLSQGMLLTVEAVVGDVHPADIRERVKARQRRARARQRRLILHFQPQSKSGPLVNAKVNVGNRGTGRAITDENEHDCK